MVDETAFTKEIGSENRRKRKEFVLFWHVGRNPVSCIPNSLQFVAPKMPQGEARGGSIPDSGL